MVPKNLAIAGPERAAVVLVPPLVVVAKVLGPLVRVMDRVSKAFVRGMGAEPKDEVSSAFTAEEVHHIVAESHREGLVEEDQYGLVGAALEFNDKDAGDVGVPVGDLVTVPVGATPNDIERLVARHGFSRYPTVDATGELTGYLHLKDVLYADESAREEPVPGQARPSARDRPRGGRRRGRAGDDAAHRLPPRPGRRRVGDHRRRVPRGRPRGARRRGHRLLAALSVRTLPPTGHPPGRAVSG